MHTFEDVKILKVFLLASSEIFLFSYSDQIYTQDIYQEYLGQAQKTEFLAMLNLQEIQNRNHLLNTEFTGCTSESG
jgi:hypothetical protein